MPPPKRVAVIGAGAAGLSVTRRLLLDGHRPTIFESTAHLGGTWAYSHTPAAWTSLYQSLRCNIPAPVMAFRDYPFPPSAPSFPAHETVLKYLQHYAHLHALRPHIRFRSRVTRLHKADSQWHVSTGPTSEPFDCVVVAVGHYTTPNPWRPRGTDLFLAPTRSVSHSHYYKTPHSYAARSVLVVGAGPSGSDIALELARSGATVCISHARAQDAIFNGVVKEVPPLESLTARGDAVLQDGSVVSAIDDVILCTGYRYTYPFLSPGIMGVSVAPDGRSVRGLVAHLYAREDPTLAFMGLVWKVIPFPLFEDQAAFLSALWGGRVSADSLRALETAEDRDWDAALEGESRFMHRLGPRQWEYRRRLACACGEALPEMSLIEVARDASAARSRDLIRYREREYKVYGSGPGEWRVFERGVDVTGRDGLEQGAV